MQPEPQVEPGVLTPLSLLQVCALGIDGLRCQATQLVLTPDERKRCSTQTWFALSQRLLQLGDGTGRPQVRYIQCVRFLPSRSSSSVLELTDCTGQRSSSVSGCRTAASAGRRAASSRSWRRRSARPRCVPLLLALRLSHSSELSSSLTLQLLGIHRLTDDPQVMPPADPAWPPNACSLRRELALRLFGLLSFLDCASLFLSTCAQVGERVLTRLARSHQRIDPPALVPPRPRSVCALLSPPLAPLKVMLIRLHPCRYYAAVL